LNKAQLLAADPKVSAWVTASAGTGKTKVLTDRILNLLLQGFAPERILCLTFTKAAAAEMASRLMNRLAEWATLSQLDLIRELKVLVGEDAVPSSLLGRARQLFSLVLDTPGGMKIQTIHGFCQSVLGRFPLEAGIPPHFRVLDDILSEEILLEAQHRVFAKFSPPIVCALEILNPYMADQRFSTILKDFYDDRSRVMTLLNKYKNFWSYAGELLIFLEVDSFIERPEQLLEPGLIPHLKAQFTPPEYDFESYIDTYLTQKREIRKKLFPEQIPEAEHVFRFVRSLSALELAQRTTATLVLFQEIMQEYEDQKMRRGVLDYDDLIQKTQRLLNQSGIAAWVLYKLDGGINHLLIDEAQDTNAAQWDIVLSLTAEFFTQDNRDRTIFAVGDAKQSIYSFQGANPEDFLKLKDHFASMTQTMGQTWRDVQLDLSYRSTAAILSIVDEVFANDQTKQGVSFGQKDIVHHVFREGSKEHLPGVVELWPLIESKADKKDNAGEWQLPLERVERRSPQYCLAQYLADQVAQWIVSKGILPSTHQPIQPRDILILVRKRSMLSEEIIRALKKRNIPIAGSDRLVLTDYIAVMDLLALAQFVLLPEDDLNLACVLRSPLIGIGEEDLFTIAHGREGTLWASLSKNSSLSPSFEMAHRWLKACLHESDLSPVYEFFNWVLIQGEGRRRFLSRLGQEAEDVIEEFLTQCLKYDREHAGSLQGFVHFMSQQSQEIKRDSSDTVHNQVRLMTIHGSKGLQAPIVILPDASEAGKERWDPLLWGDNLVMLRPSQIQDTDKTRFLKDKGAYQGAQEKRRLLYVALTRAQDRLYVGGWTLPGRDVAEESWYRLIQNAVQFKSGTNCYYHGDDQSVEEWGIRQKESFEKDCSLPAWALSRPIEPAQKKTGLEEKRVLSSKAIERGILIHRFFEYLPQFPENHRYIAASQIVEKEGLSISDWERDIQATLGILSNSDFKCFFGPDSLSEVPISGSIDGVSFQGRIDRLLVTKDTITIIDYKTDRAPPTKMEDIPKKYIKQLEGYATALKFIYPSHQIRKILLWTAGPRIQVLCS